MSKRKAPMTTDTIFRIASMTKPIASVALMMLYEEGHFLLNDPIAKFLPEFANMKVAQAAHGGGTRRRALQARAGQKTRSRLNTC